MKIALVTDGITPFVTGGMQKHSFYLAKFLTLNNFKVTLFHCVYSDEIPDVFEINKHLFNNQNQLHKIITLKFPFSKKFPGHYLYNSYRYSKLVYNIIKKDINSFDFIYVKGFSGWKLLKEKKKGLKIPILGINFNGINIFLPVKNFKLKLYNLIFKPFVKFNLKNSDFIFSYGGKVTSTITNCGVLPQKVIEIPTGIESKFVVKKNKINLNKKLKFLFVGRDDEIKGISEIFKALKKIDNNLIDFEFVGPISKKLNYKNIKYHGLIRDKNNIYNIMDQCDVLILPSYSEGMPNVILEAMARGLIIIASDVGAVNLLVSKENGILLKNQNYKYIVDAINFLVSLKSIELIEMKYSSISKINESYIWDVVRKKMINNIEKIIN